MTPSRQDYERLKGVIAEAIPGFEVRYKDRSGWQRLISLLLFFNRGYMTRYTTTLYPYVYYPSQEFEESDFASRFFTLAHEYVHLHDMKEHRLWFPVSYLSPQIWSLLSLGSIGAIWNPWFWLFLCALLLLLPFPSPDRARWEMRGYGMNLFLEHHLYGQISDATILRIEKQFTGAAYYFMWPLKAQVSECLGEMVRSIQKGAITRGDRGRPYRDVLSILKGREGDDSVQDR